MTTEEKARAYDEALKRAKAAIDIAADKDLVKGVATTIFPELREIEDERIRKALVWHLKAGEDFVSNGVTKAECIAYLEKQKEQVTDESDKIAAAYQLGRSDERKQQEQKPELVQQPPITYTYNSNASRDERLKAALLALLNSDLLKVKEGGYFTKQDLIDWVERIPTDKPVAWSEEDKKILDDVSHILIGLNYKQIAKDYKQAVEKLIYARPSWKPSEEQMTTLNWAANGMMDSCIAAPEMRAVLRELYEQLKKL